jgi:hypothetical protein
MTQNAPASSLAERKSLFLAARDQCRNYIQAFHVCARDYGGPLAAPCRPMHMAQNLCQGRFFCPREAQAAAQAGGEAEALALDRCCRDFLATLRADHAAAAAAAR